MLVSSLLPPVMLPYCVLKSEMGGKSHSFRLQEISPPFLGLYDIDFSSTELNSQ